MHISRRKRIIDFGTGQKVSQKTTEEKHMAEIKIRSTEEEKTEKKTEEHAEKPGTDGCCCGNGECGCADTNTDEENMIRGAEDEEGRFLSAFGVFPPMFADFARAVPEFFGSEFMPGVRNIRNAAEGMVLKDGTYTLEIPAPGFSKDEISVTADGKKLTVKAEKKTEAGTRKIFREYMRSDWDLGDADAECSNGLLTVRVPAAKQTGRNIEVR